MSFHIRDGWYFEGRPDGAIRVAKVSNSCTHEIVINKNEWESVLKEVGIVQPIGRGAKLKPKPVTVNKPVTKKEGDTNSPKDK